MRQQQHISRRIADSRSAIAEVTSRYKLVTDQIDSQNINSKKGTEGVPMGKFNFSYSLDMIA